MPVDYKKIDAVVSQIEKIHGQNSVVKLGSAKRVPVSVISTGVLSVDVALGVGGFARGRIFEAFGEESSGKTTLTLQGIAQAQKAGGAAFFIDAENALDLKYAEALGVDTKNLYVSQPDNGEQALEICDQLVPVSYTHLDVYKRQAQESIQAPNDQSRTRALFAQRRHH